jgi:hypothetical protein
MMVILFQLNSLVVVSNDLMFQKKSLVDKIASTGVRTGTKKFDQVATIQWKRLHLEMKLGKRLHEAISHA